LNGLNAIQIFFCEAAHAVAFFYRIDFAESALALVSFANPAIANSTGNATAIWSGTADHPGIWIFNHELTADNEAIAIHLPEICTGRRGSSIPAQHQCINENLHDTSLLVGAYRVTLLGRCSDFGCDVSHQVPIIRCGHRAARRRSLQMLWQVASLSRQ